VRLNELPIVQDPAQEHRGVGDGHRKKRVARLGRGQHVADRADPADPGGDGRHLAERPALAELLEAAKLRDMEAGAGDGAVRAQMQRDLGVAFDACDGFDDDPFEHQITRNAGAR
jgi:hypothetical protein